MFYTTLFGSWIVALLVVLWAGWGLTELLTPPALRSVQPLLMPFFGYALVSLSSYYLLWIGIALDSGRWIMLALASLINGLAWWTRGRRASEPQNWAEVGLVAGLGLAASIVAVLPLFFHGLLGPIGDSWDVEFYLPLATYLRRFPYADLGAALPNPLVPTIQVDPTYARAIGFTYFHGIVDSFGGWDALRTFAPLLGWMRGLGAIAVFLLARYGLRLSATSAGLATALVALNELLLWVQYTGFAMHTSSMALVPITLLLTILALRDLQPRTTLAAAGLLAGLAANYHPALLGYGALAAGAGLWYLLGSERRLAVLGHGLGLLLIAGSLTFLIHLRAERAFFKVYEQGAAALGTPDYIGLPTLLGLTPLASAEAPAPPPWGSAVASIWPGVIWATYGLALLLSVIWLLRGQGERGLAATMLLLAAIYAFGLRQVVGYPYGHMKGLSFISFLPLTVIGGALASLAWKAASARRSALRIVQMLASGLLLLVVGATAWSSFNLVRREPTLYGRERLRLLELSAIVPAGAPVFVSGAEELRGPTMGLAAYALRHNPLVGRTATGYTVYDRLPEGVSAPYGLLGPNDDPTAWGFDPTPLWRSPIAALYPAPAKRLAHLHGQPAAYTAPYPGALHGNTALELALLGGGRYHTLDQPLDLAVGADTLTVGGTPAASAAATRVVRLQVGALRNASIQITGAGISQTSALAPGMTIVETPPFTAPVVLRIHSDQPVILRWAELYPTDAPAAIQSATLLVGTSVTPTAGGARISVQSPASPERLRMALEIYEDSGTPRHYGWAVLPLASGTLDLDLQNRTLEFAGAPMAANWGERAAGRYFAALWIYQGETLIGRLPLLTFSDDGAQISAISGLDSNALVLALPTPADRHSLPVGALAELVGTTWQAAKAGGTARLSVWWRGNGPTAPTLVTAQVLDATNRKWAQWDGILGGDAVPSATWNEGQIVRQDIPLQLDPATAAGRYRLLIGVYNPADGSRIAIGSSDGLELEVEVEGR